MSTLPNADKIRKYEHSYGIDRRKFEELYIDQQVGLRGIERELGIPYRALKAMADHYGIRRTARESILLQNSKLCDVFMAKYGVDNPSRLESVRDKISASFTEASRASRKAAVAKTNMERYGVPCVFQTPAVKEKIKTHNADPRVREARRAMCAKLNASEEFRASRAAKSKAGVLARHGVDNPFQIKALHDKIHSQEAECARRAAQERAGHWVAKEHTASFKAYRREVMLRAKKDRDKILHADSVCYYTGLKLVSMVEFRKTHPGAHYRSNPLLPSVDHKISILRGFLDGLSIDDISNLSNLCPCALAVNREKNNKNENEYQYSDGNVREKIERESCALRHRGA